MVRPERSWSHISAAGVWGLLPLWVSTWRGLSTPCIPPYSSFFFLINQVSTVWPESEGAVLLYLFTISFSLNCLFLKKNGYNLYKNFFIDSIIWNARSLVTSILLSSVDYFLSITIGRNRQRRRRGCGDDEVGDDSDSGDCNLNLTFLVHSMLFLFIFI